MDAYPGSFLFPLPDLQAQKTIPRVKKKTMKTPGQTINATVPIRNLLAAIWRRGFVLLALGLSLALLPTARAVDPPPDGGYANSNTAEGENAPLN